MPTVLRIGAYRFFFYANDRNEPYHVHVEREDKIAKFWLEPVRLETSGGFNRQELNRKQKRVEDKQREFIESCNEYFSN